MFIHDPHINFKSVKTIYNRNNNSNVNSGFNVLKYSLMLN